MMGSWLPGRKCEGIILGTVRADGIRKQKTWQVRTGSRQDREKVDRNGRFGV
jgi:hypothetical protein